ASGRTDDRRMTIVMVSQARIEQYAQRRIGLFPPGLPLQVVYASHSTAIKVIAHRNAKSEGDLRMPSRDSVGNFKLPRVSATEISKSNNVQWEVRRDNASQ